MAPELRTLLAAGNNFETIDDLRPLRTCRCLTTVDLRNNNLESAEGLIDLLQVGCCCCSRLKAELTAPAAGSPPCTNVITSWRARRGSSIRCIAKNHAMVHHRIRMDPQTDAENARMQSCGV